MAWSTGYIPFLQRDFSNGFTVNLRSEHDNLKLTELQMHSVITVTSSFLTKEEYLYFSSNTYNLILEEKKNKTYYQNI